MSAHGTPWRPLGVLLVEQGVISEAELETALAEQAASGKPLGEILIAHGFSSRPAIQDALAEQSGVMFEPERGFGTGLRGLLARKHRQRKEGDAPSRPQLAVVPPLAVAEVEVEVEVEAQPRRLAAGAASTDTRAPGVNLLRPVERPQPTPPPVPAASPAAALPAPAAPAPPAPSEPPAQPNVEAQLDELRTAQARTSNELTRIGNALARVQAELAELRAVPPAQPVVEPVPEAVAESEPGPAREEPEPTPPEPSVEVGHLRFVLGGGAYRIETDDGPVPAVGDRVEIDARPFRVVKLAGSPLPGDERRCAYLLGD